MFLSTYFWFFILYFLFYSWLTWRKPILALSLIIAFLPSYQIRFKILGLPMTVLEVMILILFIVYSLRNYEKITKVRKLFKGWFWLILAWLVIATIAIFVSPNLRQAAGLWKAYFVEPILFLIVLVDLVRTKKEFKFILFGLFFSAFWISLWAIAQKLFSFGGVWSLEKWPSTKVWRATGPFPYPNALGLYLAPIIVLVFNQLIIEIKNYKLKLMNQIKIKNLLAISYWLLVITVALIAIILARSEAAILAIFVGTIFLGLLYYQSRKWLITILIISIVFASIFFALCLNSHSKLHQLTICTNKVSKYFLQKITFQDFSAQLRLKIWQETWQMLKNRPIFGAGLAGYQSVMKFYHRIPWAEIYLYPHNLFLNFWSELGIFGLFVFLLIIFKFFNDLIKNLSLSQSESGLNKKIETRNLDLGYEKRLFLFGLASSMIVILSHGLFDVPYFKNDLAVLFWLVIGLMIINKNLKNQ